jgi:hypothetical protein
MNRNAGRLVGDDKLIILTDDSRRPVDGLHRKSFGLKMHANVVPRGEHSIRTNPLALVIDGAE